MPEISLTEEQAEYLEDLREYIAEEHVGPYGHVRMQDAVQFLIDRYEAEDETHRAAVRQVVEDQLADDSYQELQSRAADVEGVEPSGEAADLRERLVEARVDELLAQEATGANDAEESDEETETDTETAASDTAGADQSESHVDGPGGDGGPGGVDPESDSAGASEETVDASASGGDPLGSPDSDDGGSRLQRMMGLLDRHEDAWEETDGDEGKYAVTLPDGSVENVRTRDDVRALLFKHYE